MMHCSTEMEYSCVIIEHFLVVILKLNYVGQIGQAIVLDYIDQGIVIDYIDQGIVIDYIAKVIVIMITIACVCFPGPTTMQAGFSLNFISNACTKSVF